MGYFRNFPTIEYTFSSDGKPEAVEFQNLIRFSEVIQNLADNQSLYEYYNVRDGERPDTVSRRLYGTTDYYWTFYLLNEDIRHCGWPLSEAELALKLAEDIPGNCLVFLPQDDVDTGNDTGWLQAAMIEQFEIGGTIFGSVSGASGTIYARNVNLGQIFVRLDPGSPNFNANETVVDTESGAPNFSLITRIVHAPASLAIHHFEDGDGDHVDVDYALEFRGRGSEEDENVTTGLPANAGPGPDGNYIGGVVGDLTFPDPYAELSPYSAVTFKEYYDDQNDSLSRIRVIRQSAISEIVRLFNRSINEGG